MVKVLIIEDDPMVAEINMNYIRKVSGFNIIGWVKNGEEAFEFISSKEVDLLVLDIYMPKVSGIELLKRLRKEFREIDVIFVTAARETNIIDQGLKLGAVDYLVKPFTFERMKIALEKYRDRIQILSGREEMSQEDIDKIFDKSFKLEHPKGINEKTLKNIMDYINKLEYELELEDISKSLKISSVTARHYLEYLVNKNIIRKEIKYGDIGRPKNIYHK